MRLKLNLHEGIQEALVGLYRKRKASAFWSWSGAKVSESKEESEKKLETQVHYYSYGTILAVHD